MAAGAISYRAQTHGSRKATLSHFTVSRVLGDRSAKATRPETDYLNFLLADVGLTNPGSCLTCAKQDSQMIRMVISGEHGVHEMLMRNRLVRPEGV